MRLMTNWPRKFAALVACLFLFGFAAHACAGASDDIKDILFGAPEDSSSGAEKGPEGADKAQVREIVQAGVKANAAYLNPDAAASPRFKVTLDSESVDLGKYRFEQGITLRDSNNKTYRLDPVSVSGDISHREAVIEFKSAYIENVYYIELVISGITEGGKDIVFRFDRQ